jgi:hypothetical protein
VICKDGRMLVIGRGARVAAVCAAAVFTVACSSGSPDPAPSGPLIDVARMRAALLQPADVGPAWSVPQESASPNQLVSFCGGDTAAPSVPDAPAVVAAPLSDEGAEGAQTLNQTALVYGDAAAAAAALATFRAVAQACPATVAVPQKTGGDRQEAAYTETVTTTALDEGGWSGFVVVRHKQYDAKHPATADTAVAVLARNNVVLVDAYAIFRLDASSSSPQFTSDWQKLVGTVVSRVTG